MAISRIRSREERQQRSCSCMLTVRPTTTRLSCVEGLYNIYQIVMMVSESRGWQLFNEDAGLCKVVK